MNEDIGVLLAKLTLEEKASLVSGADFWHLKPVKRLGIPAIMLADGPHGLRKQDGAVDHVGLSDSVPATCFPTASATASSWDRSLIREIGVAIAEECLKEGVSVVLGPGVNIKRSPLCGRNFEYLSEDPCLSGEMAAAFIEGAQSLGVGTSLKHFAVNNQEERRMSIDAVVDERSLRELYLPAFEKAIKKARPWTVMCAYNRLGGTYCSENGWLLDTVLRKEWGFEGLLVTDWGASNDRIAGLAAGMDLEMPSSGPENAECIVKAVRSGLLPAEVLDRSVFRILALVSKSESGRRPGFACDLAAHHALARKAARESMVLLRNEGSILPLKPGTKVALIGDFAREPRFQGSGSSLINPALLDTALVEIPAFTRDFSYSKGYDQSSDIPDGALVLEAVEAARLADVAIVFAGLPASYEMEGADRSHLALPASHEALIKSVAAANPATVVVLSNGSAVEMPWLDKVAAVLEGFLSGEAGAGAALDLLFGTASPCGKLSETFPASLDDLPSTRHFPEGPVTVEYREGLYVGYRWYDALATGKGSAGVAPLFPFGFGLSYTSFAYSGLSLSASSLVEGESLTVRFSVANTGGVPGAEIAQLYVRDIESTVYRPVKELKAFAKLSLAPGESKEARLELDRRAFAYWDSDLGDWNVETGDFEILVGASCADIRLRATVKVETGRPGHKPRDLRSVLPAYYEPRRHAAAFPPADGEFAALLGRPLPPKAVPDRAAFDMSSTLEDTRGSLLGRLVFSLVLKVAKSTAAGGDAASTKMLEKMVGDLPMRNLAAVSGGMPTFRMVRILLMLLNIGRKKPSSAREATATSGGVRGARSGGP